MRRVHGLVILGIPPVWSVGKFARTCSVRESRALMTEDEYWDDVARALGWNTEPDDGDLGVPIELLSLSHSPCAICGEYGPCGSDQDGRPWIHCTTEEED